MAFIQMYAGAEANACGICSTQVVTRGVLDCCIHWFCFACIDDWATVTNLCPLCKAHFKFITCLPLGYGDPEHADNIGAGFAKRVDGSADEESSIPFSFPSYFIDEEAVICLEGDVCRVRAGLPALEVEGALAADTSVACDLCDCWYHAGCVDFDPDQSAFYCPRCIASQEKPQNSWQRGQAGAWISPEASASSSVGLLPSERELSCGGGTLLGSNSVAIAAAEKGESVVSISMHSIPVQSITQHKSYPVHEDRKEVVWSPIREPINASQSYSPIWSPIREPLNISQSYELWSPTPSGPTKLDENDEGLWSPTPDSDNASGSSFKEQPIAAPIAPVNSFAASNSMIHNKLSPEVSICTSSKPSAARPHLSKQPACKQFYVTVGEPQSHTKFASSTKPLRKPDDFTSPVGTKKDEKTVVDNECLQSAVEQLKKGRRKALQEDERRIESTDLPEPPHKVARTFSKKNDASKGKYLAAGKDSSNNITAEENVGDKTLVCQRNDLSNAVISKDTSEWVSDEEVFAELMDDHGDQDNANEASKEKTADMVEVMDIISDHQNHVGKEIGETSSMQKGVRTRIIMHRETDANEIVGSGLVERIRQQMKETAGYVKGEDLSKVEVSDDRFVAAFKAALLSSREKNKETMSSVSRQGKSVWTSKVLNQKNQVKGSRESLTRKLYAGGTGHWDRDWDIAFWKERSAYLRQAQKEVEDGIKSLGRTGNHAKDDKHPEEQDSIFSRIYVADTSLFPRNGEAQLLSAQAKILVDCEGGQKKKSLDKSSRPATSIKNGFKIQLAHNTFGMFDTLESRTTSTPTPKLAKVPGGMYTPSKDDSMNGKGSTFSINGKQIAVLGSSPKISTKPGLQKRQVSGASVASLDTILKCEVRKDKRQWALDVLARKTGSSLNSSSNTLGFGNAPRPSDNSEGQFSLLLQLPLDMRPLLPHNRHSKVPNAVRQIQLNRLVEQELKNTKVVDLLNSPECQEAIDRAKASEEELYKKCSSKGVYVNLCVRSLAQTQSAAEMDPSDSVQKALEATGLVDSPVTSSSHNQDDQSRPSTGNEVQFPSKDNGDAAKDNSKDDQSQPSTSNEVQVPNKDGGHEVKDTSKYNWVDNVLEMGNSNISGDFVFSLDNDLEDTNLPENLQSSRIGASTVLQDAESKSKKMVVILSTVSNVVAEVVKSFPVTALKTQESKEMTQDIITRVNLVSTPEVSIQTCPWMEEDDDLHNGLEGRLTAVSTTTDTNVAPENNPTHLVAANTPFSKESSHLSAPNQGLKSIRSKGLDGKSESLSDVKKSDLSTPPVIQNMDDWMNSGKFADLDRRIESIRQSTSPSVNPEIDVPWSASRRSSELASQTSLVDSQQSVQNQVEIYVNQHLKPLYRSGVIKADQFRYAVSKTAAKVMEHHKTAISADFLITEGSKVQKLAVQYLQNFVKRKLKESRTFAGACHHSDPLYTAPSE